MLALAALASALVLPAAAQADRGFLSQLTTVSTISSTVPTNGDLNPYGVAVVPHTVGALLSGSTLVSNFNDAENLQGTGSTIVEISPAGTASVFAQLEPAALPGSCPGGVGLSTALAVLPGGYVVVGSLPTENGLASTAHAGCLIVLDSHGRAVDTIAGSPIDGPWDMTAVSHGDDSALFVTNVLNGTVASGPIPNSNGTVVRVRLDGRRGAPPVVTSEQVIAEGFTERTDPAALVIGPTGLALSHFGALYVADTLANRIAAVPDAMFRTRPIGLGGLTVTTGDRLAGPLGLTLTPTGHILTANASNGNIVETDASGKQVASVDTGAGAGGLFGLAI
ncbi:MAG: NHL repeat-containing protein, partial [Dehalococcoidia bacterium]